MGAIFGVGSILYSKLKNKDFNSMIPYGPFISIASLMVILYGDRIINWYINLIL